MFSSLILKPPAILCPPPLIKILFCVAAKITAPISNPRIVLAEALPILSFKEILSDSIFWILTIIFTLQLTANLGVYTHIPIFSQDLGYSPLQASWIYSVAAFHAAMGKIVFGRLLDNLGARRTIFISLLFHGLGIAILIFATNLFMLLIAVMIMGLGLGGTCLLYTSPSPRDS